MTFLSVTTLKRCTIALLLALAAPAMLSAQENAQTSERAGEDLGKLQELIDAKNWNGAINLLNGILRYAAPNSYDQALANDILSKIYLQVSDYAASIPPMEKAYQLGEAYKFFDTRSQLDRIYYLAQLYYQEANNTKSSALQQQYFTKAAHYIDNWLKNTPRPTEDARLFYATLLYNQATLNPDNVDKVLLKKAQEQVNEGLHFTINPKENFYVILLATLQQSGEIAKTAEILELLVHKYPSKLTYWQQLMGTYANLAAEAKSPEKAEEYNLRTIVTIERAQALGMMDSPKDNYNLVGIYFNLGQHGEATKLLHKGLRDGTIESDVAKWELLSYSYQQINKEFQAIEALQEASKHFPDTGRFDHQIAQIYYSLNRVEEAHKHVNLAINKGNLDKAGAVYYFLAYISFELLKFEEALVAVNKAAEFEENRDSQLPRLKQAIEDAIKEREAVKAQLAAQSN